MNQKPLSKLLNSIGAALRSVFGQVHWSSPSWLSAARQKAKTSPKTFWGLFILIAALLAASVYALQLYNNRPKPIYVTAQITQPQITPNDETLVPQNLTINFGLNNAEFTTRSVAPINLIGKTVTKGIEMTPKINGEWVWNTDSQLLFIPSEEWSADQKYTINFSPEFFAAGVQMESYEYAFNTKEFTAKIVHFKFYQDPVNPDIRSAVATIEFNYAVNPQSLEQYTSIVFPETKNGTHKFSAEPVKFTYTYDGNK